MSLDAPQDGYGLAAARERRRPAPWRGPRGRSLKVALALLADIAGPALCGWVLDGLPLAGALGGVALARVGLAAGVVLAAIGLAAGTYGRPALLRPPLAVLLGLWILSLGLVAVSSLAAGAGGGDGAARLALLGVLGAAGVMGARELLAAGFAFAHASGWLERSACLVVAREAADARVLARALQEEADLTAAATGGPETLLQRTSLPSRLDLVLVQAAGFRRTELAGLQQAVREAGLAAAFLGAPAMQGVRLPGDAYAAHPVFHHVRGPLGPLERAAKRGLDIGVAGLALVVLAPLLAAVAAGLALSGRRVFVWQQALDFDGRVLHLPRFGGDGAGILDRSGLQALPLLLTVLRGRLSLVGPLALPPGASEAAWRQARRARMLGLKPGLAPVHSRGPANGPPLGTPGHADDVRYCDQWSLGLECGILMGTFGGLCFGPSCR